MVLISIHCVVPVLGFVLLTGAMYNNKKNKYRVMLEQSHVIMCRLFFLSLNSRLDCTMQFTIYCSLSVAKLKKNSIHTYTEYFNCTWFFFQRYLDKFLTV